MDFRNAQPPTRFARKAAAKHGLGLSLLTPSSEIAGRELNLTVHLSTVASGTLTQLPRPTSGLMETLHINRHAG
jgi:hypothetical protein